MSIQPDYKSKAHGIELYQGDAVKILPELVERYAGKGDLLCTDPPYGIAYVSNHRSTKDKLGEAIHNDENLDVLALALPAIDKLMANDRALYFFGHPNMIGENRALLDPYWNYKNTLVWDKGQGGTFGDLKAGYSLNYESIFYYNKGRKLLNGSRPRTILRHDHDSSEARLMDEISFDEYLACIAYLLYELPDDKLEQTISKLPEDVVALAMRLHPKSQIRIDWSSRNDPVHPTAKPVQLMALLIKYSTSPSDLVIDPFMGTSPVGAACKMLGRRFIGIELDPEYFRIAQTRIEKTKKR